MKTVFDVIIAGGSFAGLAVASQLQGRVLLIDRKSVGTEQTSACGTILAVLKALDAEEVLLQVHHRIVIHTASQTLYFPLLHPFCTFDYERLCQILASRGNFDFLLASVQGLEDSEVLTSQGRIRGRYFVDATGWRAALSSRQEETPVARHQTSFGLETAAGYQEEGLHFWVDPQFVQRGVTWIFPCGEYSRIGMGSYVGESALKERLANFLGALQLSTNGFHGGYFPWTKQEPTRSSIFRVGDAAGQCLPATGEGIRNALYFGTYCGQLIQSVLEGRLTLEEALRKYERFVRAHEEPYRLLLLAQKLITYLPNGPLTWLGRILSRRPILDPLLQWYVESFDLERLIAEEPREGRTLP